MHNYKCEFTEEFISDLRHLVCECSTDERTFPPRERLVIMSSILKDKNSRLRKKVDFINEELYSAIEKNSELLVENIFNCYVDWDRRHICEQLRECTDMESLYFKTLKCLEDNGINLVHTGQKEIDTYVVDCAVLSYLYYDAIDFITDDLYHLIDTNNVSERYKYDYLLGGKPVSKSPLGSVVYEGDLGEVLKKYEQYYLNGKELKDEDTFNLKYYKVYTTLMELNIVNSLTKKEFNSNVIEYVKNLEDLILRTLYTPIEIPNEVVLGLEEFKVKLEEELISVEYVKGYFKSKPKLMEEYSKYVETVVKTYNDRLFYIYVIKPNLELLKMGFSNFPNVRHYLVILNHINNITNFGINVILRELHNLLDNALRDVVGIIKKVYMNRSKEGTDKQYILNCESKLNKEIFKALNIYNYRELNKLAKSKGFVKTRQKGDHGIFKRLDGTVVVIPQGRDIGKGLSCKIQKDIR